MSTPWKLVCLGRALGGEFFLVSPSIICHRHQSSSGYLSSLPSASLSMYSYHHPDPDQRCHHCLEASQLISWIFRAILKITFDETWRYVAFDADCYPKDIWWWLIFWSWHLFIDGWWNLLVRCGGESRAVKVVQVEGRIIWSQLILKSSNPWI